MDNNYMLLQNRNVRIPLLSKDGSWKFTINRKKWEIPLCMELLYAYHLIGAQDYAATSATLRANYRHITPIQIEEFIQYFEKTHIVEEYQFNMEEVPVYATDKDPLEIPTDQSYQVLLTPKQEWEVLELMKEYDNQNRRYSVRQWFRKYTERYALKPRNPYQVLSHYDDLAKNFCELHGVNIDSLYDIEAVRKQREEKKKEEERFAKRPKAGLIMIFGPIFIILGYIVVAALCWGILWFFVDTLFYGGEASLFD